MRGGIRGLLYVSGKLKNTVVNSVRTDYMGLDLECSVVTYLYTKTLGYERKKEKK
jgi:hypothetical protein